MKKTERIKFLPVLCLTGIVAMLTVTAPVHATLTLEECPPEIGSLFNGQNSGTYCVSNIGMTWWSAFTWCTGIGGKLATWAEACPGSAVGNKCANMQRGEDPAVCAWTAEPIDSAAAYCIRTFDGYTNNCGAGNFTPKRTESYIKALCI